MQNFTWSFTTVEEGMAHTSILATVASPFAYVIAPVVGVVAWQLAAATITGFIAKENVVGTLAVCFGIANLFNLEELSMVDGASNAVAATFGMTSAAALAFLMLNLFTPPCFAAIGAMNAELKSKKWLFAGIGLQIAVGYTVGFMAFFFGTLISGEEFVKAWMPRVGWCIIAFFATVITAIAISSHKKLTKEYQESLNKKKIAA